MSTNATPANVCSNDGLGVSPRFARTFCSQCGGEFGAGDEGFSHCADHRLGPWQKMRTAPKDGTAVLVLLNASDIPHGARWLRGTDDPHATDETAGPGWHRTWDGTPVSEHDGPRYWMHCPDDPDA